MGVFQVFKIVHMKPNRAKRLKRINPLRTLLFSKILFQCIAKKRSRKPKRFVTINVTNFIQNLTYNLLNMVTTSKTIKKYVKMSFTKINSGSQRVKG